MTEGAAADTLLPEIVAVGFKGFLGEDMLAHEQVEERRRLGAIEDDSRAIGRIYLDEQITVRGGVLKFGIGEYNDRER